MGGAEEPLKGFSWRSGTARETTGIIFWSDVFLYDNPNGQKIAILVVDTQGLFDNQTSTAENSRIFSLSMLLSSLEIFNLQGLVQEDHLQYLQFATEFAKYNSSNQQQDFKPFQSFMFLMRDWGSPEEFQFGFDGGQRYLNDLLVVKPNHPEELKSVRSSMKASFDSLTCCLLPYPGKNVARNANYDGRWSQMDEEFRNELKAAVTRLLKPDSLVTKKINNIEMSADMVNEYFQQFISLYQTGSSVQPQSIYETTVDKFMTAVVEKCFQVYKNHVAGGQNALADENGVTHLDTAAVAAGLIAYDTERKMGSETHVVKYREVLKKKMELNAIEWKAIAIAGIMKVRAERQRAEEAAREVERLRLLKLEQERIARETAERLEREAREREAEAARQREILHQQQLAIQAEQERARLAEEQRQREIAEQQRIEAERAAEAERARQQHHRRRKKCSVM